MYYSNPGRKMLLPAFFMSLFAATIAMNMAFPPTILAAPAAHPAEKPLASVHNRPQEQSSGDPLVLAFYYTWFDENTWTYDKLSDLPAEPYVSRDRGVMGRHIDQAKAAGIDAFLVAWYGPGGESNQTEPNLAALLDEAAARNFKIGILFETDSPFLGGTGAITGALQHAIGVHAAHPAFLRVDGRPVIFFWRPTIYGVDTWRAIRDQADPGNGTIWIAEGVDTSYLAVFDGHHLYSNTWNPPADLTYTNQKFAGLVEQGRQAYGAYKFWVATVMPGYNDVRIRPGYGFARDRAGGGYYEQAWQAAIGSNPNWVVITSFNEWPEGTYIEPSAAYGNQYLNLTAAWSGAFKAGGGQAVAANVVAAAAVSVAPPATATPAPTPTPFPEPTVPTVYVQTPLLNLRAGPGTDTFAIVGQVTANSALPIIARDATGEWWQVATDDGSAWLASAYVHAAGPLDEVPTRSIDEVNSVLSVESTSLRVQEEESPLTLLPSPTPTAEPPTYRPKLSRNP
ncbi:MAG: SH3 domain-containing protein [Caldilineaceae bacterium]|nr:SH3 domain-containing protein [Caldilineaceae bacterium]